MSIIQITKRLEIDAGHRLLNHESKCAHIHGHRFMFEFTVTARTLDRVGRIIDFGWIKRTMGTWLDENWDHAMIVEQGDPLIEWLVENKQKHYVLDSPPSAEFLACAVALAAQARIPSSLFLTNVRCFETPTCWADYIV